MLPTRCFRCFAGTVILGAAMLQALYWFGPIGFVLVLGIGIPAILAAAYYWTDLETRKGRGWNWLKDKGFEGEPQRMNAARPLQQGGQFAL